MMRDLSGWMLLVAGTLACGAPLHEPRVPAPAVDLSGSWQLCLSEQIGAPTTCGTAAVRRVVPPGGRSVYYRVQHTVALEQVLHTRQSVPPYGTMRWEGPHALRLVLALDSEAIDGFGGGLHAMLSGTGDSLSATWLEECAERCHRYGGVVLRRLQVP